MQPRPSRLRAARVDAMQSIPSRATRTARNAAGPPVFLLLVDTSMLEKELQGIAPPHTSETARAERRGCVRAMPKGVWRSGCVASPRSEGLSHTDHAAHPADGTRWARYLWHDRPGKPVEPNRIRRTLVHYLLGTLVHHLVGSSCPPRTRRTNPPPPGLQAAGLFPRPRNVRARPQRRSA